MSAFFRSDKDGFSVYVSRTVCIAIMVVVVVVAYLTIPRLASVEGGSDKLRIKMQMQPPQPPKVKPSNHDWSGFAG